LAANANIRCLEDGPTGGTRIQFGDDEIGQMINAPLPSSGGWNLSRIRDLSLAQSAYQIITEKRIWLPNMTMSEAVDIPVTTVAEIGKIGPVHRDINGYTPTGGIRGPFDITPRKPKSAPTYPVLWAHDAKNERTMSFDEDCEGIPRRGTTATERAALDLKVANIWKTASHCHFNCDFRFNSQSTGMQFTPNKTIGGTAWSSIQLSSIEKEKALVLWGNTTLGLLLRWWHSNRQQSGRGRIGVSILQTLPIFDVTALKPKRLNEAVKLFDTLCKSELSPIHEIDNDPVRKELDERFARDVLGLPALIYMRGGALELLRRKLAQEPSIRGNK
jgi:hypothetical protein